MNKYFKINWILFKNSYIRDAKVPGYIMSSILFQFAEILITLVFFNIIFDSTSSIAGWNFYQIVFMYAFAKFIISIHSYWTKRGLQNMATDLVRSGEYDFYLTKPVNPMILVSISRPRVYGLIVLIFELALAIWAYLKSGFIIDPVNIIWFFIAGFFGFFLYYFLFVITITPVFWFVKLWGLQDVMTRLNQFMRYPIGIFPFFIKIALFVIFPIMVSSYVPAATLFYAPDFRYIIYVIGITIIFGFFAIRFWNFAQKRYSSASS